MIKRGLPDSKANRQHLKQHTSEEAPRQALDPEGGRRLKAKYNGSLSPAQLRRIQNWRVLLTLVVLATAEFSEGIKAAIPKGVPLKVVSQGVPFAHAVTG